MHPGENQSPCQQAPAWRLRPSATFSFLIGQGVTGCTSVQGTAGCVRDATSLSQTSSHLGRAATQPHRSHTPSASEVCLQPKRCCQKLHWPSWHSRLSSTQHGLLTSLPCIWENPTHDRPNKRQQVPAPSSLTATCCILSLKHQNKSCLMQNPGPAETQLTLQPAASSSSHCLQFWLMF